MCDCEGQITTGWNIFFWAVISVVLLGQLYAWAQERPQEEVTVTAVEVPVRVLRYGQPVRDLTKDDFEVYENGVRQAITHIENSGLCTVRT
jgi:hypothetical protein